MRLLPLLLLIFASPQDEWWNRDYSARRPVTVINHYEDGPLPAGWQVRMPVNVTFLEMNVRKDLADLVVTHDGKPLPTFAEWSGHKVHVWFRIQKDIPARKRDDRYSLYYGNAKADRKPDPKDFDFHADFSGGLPGNLALDREIEADVEDGSLVVTNLPAHAANQSPSRMVLKDLPKLSTFAVEVRIKVEPRTGVVCSAGLRVQMKEEKKVDAKLTDKIEELVDHLGSRDWEMRENATRALIKFGHASIPALKKAAETDDAEVKWRANHIIEQIRDKNPARAIDAVLRTTAVQPPGWRQHRIARISGKYPIRTRPPFGTTLRIDRDQDDDVTILWDGGKPDTGHVGGEVESIAIVLTKSVKAPLGRIILDDIRVWRTFDDMSRPATRIGVEKKRP